MEAVQECDFDANKSDDEEDVGGLEQQGIIVLHRLHGVPLNMFLTLHYVLL